MAMVAATSSPGIPAAGTSWAARRAAPHPASHNPSARSILTRTPPSTSTVMTATKKS
ncbi:Uncharacterised protein [Mycobacteroides abscessus subsp. abscessus]|nr:Uncharacterised protein [Mycobacteroides abscessus subsp. abscessus]